MATKILAQDIDTTTTFSLSANQFTDGTAAAPSISFQGDTDTGIYHPTADTIGFCTLGVERVRLTGGTFRNAAAGFVIENGDGSVGGPAFSFSSDNDTGIYRIGANDIGVAVGGVKNLEIVSNQVLLGNTDGSAASPAFRFSSRNSGFFTSASSTVWTAVNGVATIGVASSEFGVAVDGTVSIGSSTFGFTRTFINDGSAASPAYTFSSDTDTGIYRGGANILDFSAGGTAQWRINTSGFIPLNSAQIIYVNDGTAGAPSLAFNTDTDTGMYHVGANSLGLASNGTQGMRIDAGNLVISRDFLPNADASYQIGTTGTGFTRIFMNSGTASAPSYSFSAESGLGWYRGGAARMSLAFGTVEGAFFDGATGVFGLKNNYNMQTNVGTVAIPGYSFNGDSDTGLYNISPNEVGITLGGTLGVEISSTKFISSILLLAPDGSVAAPSYTFGADQDTGMYRSGTNLLDFSIGGVQVAEHTSTGSTNATTYVPMKLFAARQQAFEAQTTTGCTTSATTICTIALDGGCFRVYGKRTAPSGGHEFCDLVIMVASGTVSTMGSATIGTPDTRTYSVSGSALRVTMGANTYTVTVAGLGMNG